MRWLLDSGLPFTIAMRKMCSQGMSIFLPSYPRGENVCLKCPCFAYSSSLSYSWRLTSLVLLMMAHAANCSVHGNQLGKIMKTLAPSFRGAHSKENPAIKRESSNPNTVSYMSVVPTPLNTPAPTTPTAHPVSVYRALLYQTGRCSPLNRVYFKDPVAKQGADVSQLSKETHKLGASRSAEVVNQAWRLIIPLYHAAPLRK